VSAVERAPPWAPPLLALQFLTRLPVPVLARLSREQAGDGLGRAMAWLPLVGTFIGSITAGVFLAASALWPPVVAALLALGVEGLLTGCFHEDAVADFCDAFGGTARGDAALRIMRDSRIGSYGTVGLGLAIGLRLAAMVALPPPVAPAAIIGAATIGRLWAVLLAKLLPPPTDGPGIAARMGSGMPYGRAASALLLTIPGILPLLLLQARSVFISAALGAVFLWWLARFLRSRIGGSTGDCLGFAAYMGQLSLLLCAAAS
jgi:adenosylcobinamide-GDP ribazoletransferase